MALFQEFRLKHFAGDVTYNTKGFLDKNNDLLFRDLKEVLFAKIFAKITLHWKLWSLHGRAERSLVQISMAQVCVCLWHKFVAQGTLKSHGTGLNP